MTKYVYLGGFIEGLRWEEAFEWREKAEIFLKDIGIKIYNPVVHVPAAFKDSQAVITSAKIINFYLLNSPIELAEDFKNRVFFQDLFHLRKADICLFNLKDFGRPVNGIGTIWELGAAFILKKLVLAFHKSSLEQHSFVTNSINLNFDCLDDALDYIARL